MHPLLAIKVSTKKKKKRADPVLYTISYDLPAEPAASADRDVPAAARYREPRRRQLTGGLPDLEDVQAVPWSSTIVCSSFAVDVLHWFVAVALFFAVVFFKPVQFHSLHAAWHGTWLQLVWNNITTCAHAHSQPTLTGAGAPYLLPRPPPC